MSRATAVLALFVIACTDADKNLVPTPAQQQAIGDSVGAASARWKLAAETVDIAGILDAYVAAPEEGAVVTGDNLAQTSSSLDSLRKYLSNNLRGARSQAIHVQDQVVSILSFGSAAETALGEWVTTDTAGKVVRNHFAYSRTWVYRPQGWKILHSSLTVLPLPAQRR